MNLSAFQNITDNKVFSTHINIEKIKYYKVKNARKKQCANITERKITMKYRQNIPKKLKIISIIAFSALVLANVVLSHTISEGFTSKTVINSVFYEDIASKNGYGENLFEENYETISSEGLKLVPCGDVFGVKFFTKGVIIIGNTDIETKDGFINPAETSGLKKDDIITKVNGKEINTVEELAGIIEKSNGNILFVEYTRNENDYNTELKPVLSVSDNKYKTGIWVRDSTAGIGTITYYNPENKSFAGLGHGICDIDTGSLMPLLRATIVDVDITEITKGKYGTPGELKGIFDTLQKGVLIKNSDFGVFGILDKYPDSLYGALEVASKNEINPGKASVLVNADGKGIKEYEVFLSKIDKYSDGTKCFSVEVTDEKLLSLTGGIVQGMSGSPIIQNGKLIGAVTHVLVNDPTKGYGIFIENMLSKMPDLTV